MLLSDTELRGVSPTALAMTAKQRKHPRPRKKWLDKLRCLCEVQHQTCVKTLTCALKWKDLQEYNQVETSKKQGLELYAQLVKGGKKQDYVLVLDHILRKRL